MQFNDRVIVKRVGQPDVPGRVICQLSGSMTIEWGPAGNAQVIVALDSHELVLVTPDDLTETMRGNDPSNIWMDTGA